MGILRETGLTPTQSAIVNASITNRNLGMKEAVYTFNGEGAPNNPFTQGAAILQGGDGIKTKE
jgi:hypothetical protein